MPLQFTMLNEIMESGAYASRSEAVRQAIRSHHKQLFPYYKAKVEKKESDKARIASQTNEEYLSDEFADFNYKVVGQEVIFKHGTMPDSPLEVTIPLGNIKNIDNEESVIAFSRKE